MILMLPPMLQFHPPLLGYKQNKFSGTDRLRHPRMKNWTWPDTCCGTTAPWYPQSAGPAVSWSCQQQAKGSCSLRRFHLKWVSWMKDLYQLVWLLHFFEACNQLEGDKGPKGTFKIPGAFLGTAWLPQVPHWPACRREVAGYGKAHMWKCSSLANKTEKPLEHLRSPCYLHRPKGRQSVPTRSSPCSDQGSTSREAPL